MAKVIDYQIVWQKYLPVINMKIKEAIRKNQPASFNVYKPEFQGTSKRKTVSYEFVLEMKNNRVFSNTATTTIAKDMSEAIRQNLAMRDVMTRAHFVFTLSEDFVLTIEPKPFVSDLN